MPAQESRIKYPHTQHIGDDVDVLASGQLTNRHYPANKAGNIIEYPLRDSGIVADYLKQGGTFILDSI